MKVLLCEHNRGQGRVQRALNTACPELAVEVRVCVGRCSYCQEIPFALVDGQLVRSYDQADLSRRIMEQL